MNPIQWLELNASGFTALSEVERQGILHFALLWSFFEARALRTHASSDEIRKLTQSWHDQGILRIEPFAESLTYFRQRYFNHGASTDYFDGLHLRENDSPALVRSVLAGESSTIPDAVAALLIVVFRLRNNLFHGTKWSYGIHGQLTNFHHANSVLMSALTIDGTL